MQFSISSGLWRSFKRAVTLGAFAGAVAALSYFLEVVPADQAVYGTILTAVIAFVEKYQRNYRETLSTPEPDSVPVQ